MSDQDHIEAGSTAPEQVDTAAPDTVNDAPEEQEPKTFTQEELNRIVAAEKAKAERKARRELQEAMQEQSRTTVEPPKPGQFQNVEEYTEALAEFKAEQKLAEREAQQRQKQTETTFADREDEARSKYSDYDSVAHNPDLPITPTMAAAIKESDLGPDLVYHLGQNPKEADRIARLSPVAQAREIGKIEASLAGAPAVVKKASSAPEPIKPIGSRASTPKYDPSDPRSVKTMSDSDWIKARNEQIAARHR